MPPPRCARATLRAEPYPGVTMGLPVQVSPMILPKAWPTDTQAPRPRKWPPSLMQPGPSPLVVWATFLVWGFAAKRKQDIPDHVLHILSFYMWLLLTGECPCDFLRDLQDVLRRTIPRKTALPAWLRQMVYQYQAV